MTNDDDDDGYDEYFVRTLRILTTMTTMMKMHVPTTMKMRRRMQRRILCGELLYGWIIIGVSSLPFELLTASSSSSPKRAFRQNSDQRLCDDTTVDGACSPVVTVTLHPAGHLTVLTEIGSL